MFVKASENPGMAARSVPSSDGGAERNGAAMEIGK